MTYMGINILVLSVFILILGLWKPHILLFWQNKPSRWAVGVIFIFLFMVGVTVFGEGSRQKQLEQPSENSPIQSSSQTSTDVPEITTSSAKINP